MVAIIANFLQPTLLTLESGLMRRIISMVTIAALLSVSTVPLLPKRAVCHAAETNTDCGTCHTGDHASHDMVAHSMHAPGDAMTEHGMETDEHRHGPHDRDMHQPDPAGAEHEMKMQQPRDIEQPQQMHKHHKKLSAAEKECRIECGCGCNHSVDGMPHLLAPHIASTNQFETGEQFACIEPASHPVLCSLILNNPPPPPKAI